MTSRSMAVLAVAVLSACGTSMPSPTGGGGGFLLTGGGPGGVTGGGLASGGGTGGGTGGGLTGGGPSGGGTGGGSVSTRNDELIAGSRLKVRTLVSTDGAQMQLGFFDTMRNERCTFYRSADGKTRCLPNDPVAITVSYFSDAGCTQPLFVQVITGPNCPTPTLGLRSQTTTCNAGYEVHTVTLATPTMIFIGAPGSCSATSASTAFRYFASTGQVPLSDFVEATEQLSP